MLAAGGKIIFRARHHPFSFFRAKNIFPLKTGLEQKYLASRKYLAGAGAPGPGRVSEEKRLFSSFFLLSGHRHEVVPVLSTKKVTEYLQKPSLI